MLEDYEETQDGDYAWLKGSKWEKFYGTTTIHQLLENPNYKKQQSGARDAGKTPDYMYAWMSNEDLNEHLGDSLGENQGEHLGENQTPKSWIYKQKRPSSPLRFSPRFPP